MPTVDTLTDVWLIYSWWLNLATFTRAFLALTLLLVANGVTTVSEWSERGAQSWWRCLAQMCGLGILLQTASMLGKLGRGELADPAVAAEVARHLTRLKLSEVSMETGPQFVLQIYAALADGVVGLGGVSVNMHADAAAVAKCEALRGTTSCQTQLLLTMAIGLITMTTIFLAYEKEHRWQHHWQTITWHKWLHPAVPMLLGFRLCEGIFRATTLATALLSCAHLNWWHARLGLDPVLLLKVRLLTRRRVVGSCGDRLVALLSPRDRACGRRGGCHKCGAGAPAAASDVRHGPLFFVAPGMLQDSQSLSGFDGGGEERENNQRRCCCCGCCCCRCSRCRNGRRCTRPAHLYHPILDIGPFLALRLLSGAVAVAYLHGYIEWKELSSAQGSATAPFFSVFRKS